MIRQLSSLLRLSVDERGTALIEFGFLAPFLALLAMGVIDLSRGLAERFALQQAVNASLELVQARPRTADSTGQIDYSFVKNEAMADAGVDATHVVLEQWLECDGEEADHYTDTCADGEDTARYLQVRISKDFHGEFYFDDIPMLATGSLRVQ
jgi:Flp pilus assembly protein TadG